MEKPQEIQISEKRLELVGIILLIFAVVFTTIGYFTSPLDETGKPVLLLPEVKAFEDYRRTAKAWVGMLNNLDTEITTLLSNSGTGDLFTQSRQAQQMLQHAVELTQEVDRVQVPAAASSIHDQIDATSMAYLDVAQLTMQWVGVPDSGKTEEINAKLEQARNLKAALEKNQWVSRP